MLTFAVDCDDEGSGDHSVVGVHEVLDGLLGSHRQLVCVFKENRLAQSRMISIAYFEYQLVHRFG